MPSGPSQSSSHYEGMGGFGVGSLLITSGLVRKAANRTPDELRVCDRLLHPVARCYRCIFLLLQSKPRLFFIAADWIAAPSDCQYIIIPGADLFLLPDGHFRFSSYEPSRHRRRRGFVSSGHIRSDTHPGKVQSQLRRAHGERR